MTVRLISNATLWGLHQAQGRTDEICDWASANGLTPNDVSADHDITIEDTPDGRVIRYRAFLRSDSGHKFVATEADGAAMEERTVPLVVEPPEGWPVYAVPGSA
ncbi:hypothetical protein [Streptomyces lasiicapitis]|uniref:hypothetical protein n=1 Tax=Streptomyces lasiicapitis TaxID=1923961 RepID=UPI0036524206